MHQIADRQKICAIGTLRDSCKNQLASIKFAEQGLVHQKVKVAAFQKAKAPNRLAIKNSFPMACESDTIKLT
jgi:hypothetical protein